MEYIDFFKALADPTRFRLLNLLKESQLNVAEMVQLMGMGQSRISRHLKILLDAGLITLKKEGLWSFYSSAEKGKGEKLLNQLHYIFLEDEKLTEEKSKINQIIQQRRIKTRQFFDSIASDWEQLKNEVIDENLITQIIQKDLGKEDITADLGCGNGDLLPILASSVKQVIGVDQSPSMMEKARTISLKHPSIELRLGELEHLPLRDKEVHSAIMKMVLHHLPHPEAGIMEAARILKPDGKFLLLDYLPHDQLEMQERFGDMWLGFSKEQIQSWLKNAGLKCKKIEDIKLKNEIKAAFYVAVKSE